METGQVFWHRRFRSAFLASTVGAAVWTLILILPFDPFDDLLLVIEGGGAGTWLTFGYLLFLAVAVGGFGSLASSLASIEVDERRVPHPELMTLGFYALLVGVYGSCFLLGAAGGVGGYVQTVLRSSNANLPDLLRPFVYAISLFAGVAVVGSIASVLGIVKARVVPRS